MQLQLTFHGIVYQIVMFKVKPKGFVTNEDRIKRAGGLNYRGVSFLMFVFMDVSVWFSMSIFLYWIGVPVEAAMSVGILPFALFFYLYYHNHVKYARRAIVIFDVRV